MDVGENHAAVSCHVHQRTLVSMSVWSSVGHDEPEIFAWQDDKTERPDVYVDVATTTHHELIRLALYAAKAGPVTETEVLLTRESATLLRDRLTHALENR